MVVQLSGRLAQRDDSPLGDDCPLDRALQAVGNRVALLLVREVLYGASRFDALVARVGVSEAAAAQRLRELVEVGVLRKEPYREAGQRTRHAYVLTDAGHDLLPAVIALLQWGGEHTPGGGPALEHADCGATVRPHLRCADGHEVPEGELLVRSRRR